MTKNDCQLLLTPLMLYTIIFLAQTELLSYTEGEVGYVMKLILPTVQRLRHILG